MNPRRALACLIILMALYGCAAGYYGARELDVPKAIEWVTTLAFAVLTYVWYYLDAREIAYQRTVPLGGAVILFSVLAVPYYLIRSRPKGQRRKAMLRFFGFGLLMLLVSIAASFPFFLMAA